MVPAVVSSDHSQSDIMILVVGHETPPVHTIEVEGEDLLIAPRREDTMKKKRSRRLQLLLLAFLFLLASFIMGLLLLLPR